MPTTTKKTLYARRSIGPLTRVRLEPSLSESVSATQRDPRGLIRGLMPSRSLIIRRALYVYLTYLLSLTPEQWKDEVAAREGMAR